MRKWLYVMLSALVSAVFPVSALAQDYGTDADEAEVSDEASEEMNLKPWEAHPEDYVLVDTVMYVKVQALDSALLDESIFNILSERNGRGGVRVNQSDDIQEIMESHFESNKERHLSGYRVRIFFDNKQSARADSETAMKKFESLWPEVEVFRSYVNPYFKVTVGNFRTRSEAMRLLQRVKREFPTAFIVKEEIDYPAIESGKEMVLDTVSFYRYIGKEESSEEEAEL